MFTLIPTRKAIITAAIALFGAVTAFAQTGSLAGLVTDESTKKPIEGVTIEVYKTDFKAKSLADGSYNIGGIAPGTYNVIFSKDQMEDVLAKVEIKLNETTNLNAALKNAISSMGDVVIVGYGRQSRRNVVGSIATVSGKEITDMPAPSFEAALQGKAAGVQVIVGSGMAGSASLIRVRGASSISAAGDPLYVIDGIPVSQDYFMNRANGSNWGWRIQQQPVGEHQPRRY